MTKNPQHRNKIEIKNRWTGEVIFAHECENNTIMNTVEQAVNNHADLRNADLRNADLRDADLHDADLRNANLSNADLRNAYLSNAYLRNADLRTADLRDADLSNANLSNAYLRNADLRNANLSNAYLSNADLRNAILSNAYLDEGTKMGFVPLACPSEGAFVGWKKVNGKLVKLLVPEDAMRSSATTNKCRCDKAQVLTITDTDGNNPIDRITNYEYEPCDYIVGETVIPDSFDEDRWNECSHGIHFFINKQEAIEY